MDHDFRFSDGYSYDLNPRYPFGREHSGIKRLLDSALPEAKTLLSDFGSYEKDLTSLPLEKNKDSGFFWNNDFFPALDALTLYGMMNTHHPKQYLEIGSGFSTKIASFAVTSQNLNTTISSIDPCPRSEIDEICDNVIREPLENVDLSIFTSLNKGDILFFDGSHRSFTNSDVTVFFLDILPVLKPGVIIQIHDITWPEDYPKDWSNRFYNEQYLLACALLFGGLHFKVLLPNAHISRQLPISELFPLTVGQSGLPDEKRGGGSFWFTKVS